MRNGRFSSFHHRQHRQKITFVNIGGDDDDEDEDDEKIDQCDVLQARLRYCHALFGCQRHTLSIVGYQWMVCKQNIQNVQNILNSHFQGFLCDSLHGRARPGASPLSDLRSSQFLLCPSRPKGCTIFKTSCHQFVSFVACCPVFCHSRFYHSSTPPSPKSLVSHSRTHTTQATVYSFDKISLF